MDEEAVDVPAKADVVALIAPHAGLVYSGPVAAYAYRLLRSRKYETIVLVGPSHYLAFAGASVWPRGAFETPLGNLPIDEELAAAITSACPIVQELASAHGREHSLEMQLPFLAAFVGVICSGLLSDWLVRRGYSLGVARKLPIISGMLISTCIFGANYVDTPALIIACLAVAFFRNGLASITWSMVSALAPARLLGLTGGVFNFVGNLSAICVPIVIGFLVQGDNFAPAITYIAVMALIGALSYGLLVGKVERIEE